MGLQLFISYFRLVTVGGGDVTVLGRTETSSSLSNAGEMMGEVAVAASVCDLEEPYTHAIALAHHLDDEGVLVGCRRRRDTHTR